MAFNLGIGVSLSADKSYITLVNEDTVWDGDILSTNDITSMVVKIYGENKTTPLYMVTLTESEIDLFVTGIQLLFTDSRWFNKATPADNYYTVVVTVNDVYKSDWEAFEIHTGLEEKVHINNASVNLRPQNLFKLQGNMQAVIALDTMTNLSNDKYAPDREYRWRKLYEYIVSNIINKY